jgi:hypothetical protein
MKIGDRVKINKLKARHIGGEPFYWYSDNIYTIVSISNTVVTFVYHINNIIVDIRIFDGEKYKNILESDYKLIKSNRNSETKILTLKKKTGLIQIKKSMDIFLSKSIIKNKKLNNISDQDVYIKNLFFNRLFDYYHNEKIKPILREEKQVNKLEERVTRIKESIERKKEKIKVMKDEEEKQMKSHLIEMQSIYNK